MTARIKHPYAKGYIPADAIRIFVLSADGVNGTQGKWSDGDFCSEIAYVTGVKHKGTLWERVRNG